MGSFFAGPHPAYNIGYRIGAIYRDADGGKWRCENLWRRGAGAFQRLSDGRQVDFYEDGQAREYGVPPLVSLTD